MPVHSDDPKDDVYASRSAVHFQCPRCNLPITARPPDMMAYCPSCVRKWATILHVTAVETEPFVLDERTSP